MQDKEIKEILEEFLEKAGFSQSSYFIKIENESVFIDIKSDMPYILTGEKGQNIRDLQFLLMSFISKKTENGFNKKIYLDINDYRKKRESYLKDLAKTIADEVSLLKKEKALNPMPSFERKIIHEEIAKREDVISESIGKEPKRKVVIKPKEK